MTTLSLNILFSALVLTGVVFVVFGIRHKRKGEEAAAEPGSLHLEFVETGGEGKELFDLGNESEILRQPEKKPFQPEKHQPDSIDSLIDKDEKQGGK